MGERLCETCRWWDPSGDSTGMEGIGECRVGRPTVMVGRTLKGTDDAEYLEGVWPHTVAYMFCGEWAPAIPDVTGQSLSPAAPLEFRVV